MIHYFYGTLQVGIGQTLCLFEHVSCFNKYHQHKISIMTCISNENHCAFSALMLWLGDTKGSRPVKICA